MRDKRARIYDNNHLDSATVTAPEVAEFPFSNAVDSMRRNKVWKPGSNSFTIQVDMGYNANVSLFSIVGPSEGVLQLSDAATITIKANMINLFTGSEPLSVTAEVTDQGVFKFLDTDDSPDGQQYRYWEITIDDSSNPDDIEVPVIFLGDELRFNHNVSKGFNWEIIDTTVRQISDNGSIYSQERTQYRRFNGMRHQFVDFSTTQSIMNTVQEVGLFKPFIFALDPTGECYGDQTFSNVLCYFDNLPRFRQILVDRFNVTYGLRELV